MNKITLFGFNNLTKSLSFSLYKLHYIGDQQERYNQFIKERYSADKLNSVLTNVCQAIGGNVLNVAKQNYQPQGASVTLMISEESPEKPPFKTVNNSLVAHLDKSHLCIHTYPEEEAQQGIAIFRADIELSTCGIISPLKVLNHVIKTFDADVIDIDYRIRGMTRNRQGNKLFNIDEFNNVSDFLSNHISNSYNISEHSLREQNLFHAKLSRKEVTLNNYIFGSNTECLLSEEQHIIHTRLSKEIQQLFLNKN